MDASDWDERYATNDLIWTAEPNRFLVEHVRDLSVGRALDVAAGEGRNAVWLAEHGWETTALDFSRAGIDKGRQLAAARGVDVTWLVADATTWEPPQRAFDLVIVFYLQLPAVQRRAAHRRAASAVTEGGTLLIVGHDKQNVVSGVGGPADPDVLLTVDEVLTDLDETGLVVDIGEQALRPTESVGSRGSAIDCLVRAQRKAPAASA